MQNYILNLGKSSKNHVSAASHCLHLHLHQADPELGLHCLCKWLLKIIGLITQYHLVWTSTTPRKHLSYCGAWWQYHALGMDSGLSIRLVPNTERSCKKACRRAHIASDRKSTSGRGTMPRQSWSGFKFESPWMTQPKFEPVLHNRLQSEPTITVNQNALSSRRKL